MGTYGFFFSKILFIYLWETHKEKEAETQAEGSRVSRIMPWAAGGPKPLCHRGCPLIDNSTEYRFLGWKLCLLRIFRTLLHLLSPSFQCCCWEIQCHSFSWSFVYDMFLFSGTPKDLLFITGILEFHRHTFVWVFLSFILLVTQWDFYSFSSGTCSCILALITSFVLLPPLSISGTPVVGCWSSSTDPPIFSSFLFCCLFLHLVILLS